MKRRQDNEENKTQTHTRHWGRGKEASERKVVIDPQVRGQEEEWESERGGKKSHDETMMMVARCGRLVKVKSQRSVAAALLG
jgi:hypothetical protein